MLRSLMPAALPAALQCEGGIYKRIDEVRELTELLTKDAPDFLVTHPWVCGWLSSTDDFLNAVANATDPVMQNEYLFPRRDGAQPFPRPRQEESWPEGIQFLHRPSTPEMKRKMIRAMQQFLKDDQERPEGPSNEPGQGSVPDA